jgi:hypothetical protein
MHMNKHMIINMDMHWYTDKVRVPARVRVYVHIHMCECTTTIDIW